jgi:hypothetical protein
MTFKQVAQRVAEVVDVARSEGLGTVWCLSCGSTGDHTCTCGAIHDCRECDGSGLRPEVRDRFSNFPRDVIAAAHWKLRESRKK